MGIIVSKLRPMGMGGVVLSVETSRLESAGWVGLTAGCGTVNVSGDTGQVGRAERAEPASENLQTKWFGSRAAAF